jgi:hypothetical protein
MYGHEGYIKYMIGNHLPLASIKPSLGMTGLQKHSTVGYGDLNKKFTGLNKPAHLCKAAVFNILMSIGYPMFASVILLYIVPHHDHTLPISFEDVPAKFSNLRTV